MFLLEVVPVGEPADAEASDEVEDSHDRDKEGGRGASEVQLLGVRGRQDERAEETTVAR